MAKDWTVYHFETVSSTQDIARQYLTEGKAATFVIRADVQTKGRGRSGHQWDSPTGNLYSTIVIPLENVQAKHVGQYSFLTAVALMECLADCGVVNAVNKWPNDILVDGRKIAGILLESDIGADGCLNTLIIGVGVNISHAPEGAIALRDLPITYAVNDVEGFLQKFIKNLEHSLHIMADQGFAPVREIWLSKAYGLGTDIRVRLPQETFYGEFIGLDGNGALLVKVAGENKPRLIHSGEVFFEI